MMAIKYDAITILKILVVLGILAAAAFIGTADAAPKGDVTLQAGYGLDDSDGSEVWQIAYEHNQDWHGGYLKQFVMGSVEQDRRRRRGGEPVERIEDAAEQCGQRREQQIGKSQPGITDCEVEFFRVVEESRRDD